MQKLILGVTLALSLGQTTWGHGMMIDPPQRSSMWRYGINSSTENYNDNQLNCGGFDSQWHTNGGKCGICGDAYDAPEPHENEAGGKYATGVIVKTYQQGATIDVAVKITANHKGYFVFKLCPNNDVRKKATQECLNKYVLKTVGPDGKDVGEKYYIDSTVNTKHLKLKLPHDVTCTQCVLQWTYVTANSWGCTDGLSRRCCIGCGPQENFVNCADVAITGSGRQVEVSAPVINAKRLFRTSRQSRCYSAGPYRKGQDQWCAVNCAVGYCPSTHCQCS